MIPKNRTKLIPPPDYKPPMRTHYTDSLLEKRGNYNFIDVNVKQGPRPTLDTFINHIEDLIKLHRPHSVIFRRVIEYLDDDMSWDASPYAKVKVQWNKETTYNIARRHPLTFRAFIESLLENDIKDIFGDDYETYNGLIILGESINVSRARLLVPKPGHGSTDLEGEAYYVVVGPRKYLLMSISNNTTTCFYDVLREYLADEVVDALHEDFNVDGVTEDYLVHNADILRSYGIHIKTPNIDVGHGILIEMCLDDGHWCKILDVTNVDAHETVNKNNHRIVAYDYETVNNMPYMFSISAHGRSRCIWTDSPGTNDFNARVADLINPYIDEGYTFIGFNSSRYDDLYLLDVLDLSHWKVLKGSGNSVLTMRHKKSGAVFIDVCRFLKMKLSQACKMLGIPNPKLDLDHEVVSTQFERDGVVSVTKDMIDYSIRDVECLVSVWLRTRDVFRDTFGLNVIGCISLSQTVYRRFIKDNGKSVPQITPSTGHVDHRDYLTGGKCHAKVGIFERPAIYVYDVNSLYPYVMMTKPFIKAAGEWRQSTKLVWHGVYKVRVTTCARVCVIPERGDSKVLEWDPQPPYVGHCSGIDIEDHMKYGGALEILDGYSYTDVETSNTMFKFLEDYYVIKRDTTDSAKRGLAKILMNSLSGKMSQKAIEEEIHITTEKPDSESHESYGKYYLNYVTKDKPTTTGSFINAVLIYSYSRRVLNSYLAQCEEWFTCDTDSVFCTNTLPTGGELGEMKLEAVGNKIYVGGKKMYSLYQDDKLVKAALKGVRQMGYYEDDGVPSDSGTWLRCAMDDQVNSFRVRSVQCVRTHLSPEFRSVQRVISLNSL